MSNPKSSYLFYAAIVVLTIASSLQASRPFATYNPAMGGIWFHEVDDIDRLRLNSRTGLLLPSHATDLDGHAGCDNFCVVNDQAPQFIEWGKLTVFEFNRVFAGSLIAPGTPFNQVADDIEFIYEGVGFYHKFAPPGEILLVPEPAMAVLFSVGAAVLSFRRSRQRREE